MTCPKNKARPIRHPAQVPDRNGKIFYTSITSLSHISKRLGDVVKQERLKLNLSQNALAEQAKVSLRTVSDIETYNGNPRLDTLYALANYLHISIDAVFSDKKSNMDSSMQQIIAELNSCPEEQKQLALSTLRGLLDGFKNLS